MAPSDLASFLAGDPPADPADKPAPETPPVGAKRGVGTNPAGGPILLNGRFEIDPSEPLPEFGNPQADAFAARQRGAAGGDMFALVCRGELPARTEILNPLRAVSHENVVRLCEFGVARWTPAGEDRLIVVYERPAGRLVKSLEAVQKPMREDAVIRKIIAPVAAALRELRNRRAVHGTVNPTTLFAPHTEGGGLQLGECVTTPPGYLQPVAFEPLGRAMASPAGRGTVAIGDDLYALGVTAMFMLFGRMPGGSLDDARLIETKIELGSYAALVGGNQLPQAITEPLRGLLLDDPAHRWSLDDLEQWLTGRRQTPRRAEIAGRTARRIPFAGKDYKNLRLLAMAMAKDTAAADEVIQDGTLEDWLGRNSGDDGIAHRVEEAKRSASVGKGGVLAERRVSRVLMVLDPQAPVRYRGLAVMAEGIGGALAEAFATGRTTQELAEIIAAQLPMAWVNAQQAADPRFAAMAGQFDLLSGFVGETSLGYGAERCLYELSPSMPCAGPLLRGRVILDASDLLRALEDIAGGAERPKEPMDRHIAAFLMAHQARLIRGPMSLLAEASTLHERCIATIAVFEIVQRRLDLPPLPQLCRWLAELAGPAIAAYHSRSLRDGLGGQLGRVWKTGLLQALGGVVNNHALAGRDRDGFLNAQAAHRQAGRIIALRRGELRRRRELSVVAGRQAASIIASLLSVVAVSGAIVMAVL